MRKQRIHSSPNRSACEQHVVHKDNVSLLHGEPHVIDVGCQRLLVGAKIVSKKGHIQLAAIHFCSTGELFQASLEAFGQSRTWLQSDQIRHGKIVVFDRLVCQSIENQRELRRGNQNMSFS